MTDNRAFSLFFSAFSSTSIRLVVRIGTAWQADAAFCRGASPEPPVPGFGQVLSVLEKEFAPIPCERCQRCICPYGTEIHTIFRQYHYYFLGKDHWALGKLNLGIEKSALYCRQCTDMPCLFMCPKEIRIPDEIQRVAALVETHLGD